MVGASHHDAALKLAPMLMNGNVIGYGHWCQGCRHMHIFYTAAENRPRWDFDGDFEQPTFSPSMKLFTPASDGVPEVTHCHYFLVDGELNFLSDSSDHALRGKHPLEDIPEEYGFG